MSENIYIVSGRLLPLLVESPNSASGLGTPNGGAEGLLNGLYA
jgi:hypothetical protein